MAEIISKSNITAGRIAVDTYREAHRLLHQKVYYRGVHDDHTPLLKVMVNALEELGFTSTEVDFEPKKNKILTKFWAESDLGNIQELGFPDRSALNAELDRLKHVPDIARATEILESLAEMWQ